MASNFNLSNKTVNLFFYKKKTDSPILIYMQKRNFIGNNSINVYFFALQCSAVLSNIVEL